MHLLVQVGIAEGGFLEVKLERGKITFGQKPTRLTVRSPEDYAQGRLYGPFDTGRGNGKIYRGQSQEIADGGKKRQTTQVARELAGTR
jgi:hypothetical protein